MQTVAIDNIDDSVLISSTFKNATVICVSEGTAVLILILGLLPRCGSYCTVFVECLYVPDEPSVHLAIRYDPLIRTKSVSSAEPAARPSESFSA